MTDTLFIPSGHFKKASGIFKTIRHITVTPHPCLNDAGYCAAGVWIWKLSFNEMEVTLPMQRVNVIKHQDSQQPQHPIQPQQKPPQQQQQPPQQHPHPEYSENHPHKVIVTAADSDGTNLMRIKSEAGNKIYTIHLEFTEGHTGMGEEIRNTLKEKYVQQELRSGSLQTVADALQSPSQEGEREGQGA